MARILVVDDAPIIRNMIRVLLVDGGHEVAAEAASGQEALEQYKMHRPDLVTLDINMPVGKGEHQRGGILTLKKLVADYPDARVIMISSHADKDILVETIKSGAKNYLLKPIAQDKLLAAIKKALGEEEAAGQG